MMRIVRLGTAAVLLAAFCSCAIAGDDDPDDDAGGGAGTFVTAGVAGQPATSAGTTSTTRGGFDVGATANASTGIATSSSLLDGGSSTGGSTGTSTLATGGSTGFTGAGSTSTAGEMGDSDPFGEIVDMLTCLISSCDEMDMEMVDAGP